MWGRGARELLPPPKVRHWQERLYDEVGNISIPYNCKNCLPLERGKAGGHVPPLFPLPGHISFLNGTCRAFKV